MFRLRFLYSLPVVGKRSFRRLDSGPTVTSTPRKTPVGGGGAVVMPSPCYPPVTGGDVDGLSQLTALVHHGEKQGLFTEKVPPKILRVVQEDNLRFFRNRDIYSEEYFGFVYQLVTCNAVGLLLFQGYYNFAQSKKNIKNTESVFFL